MSEELNPIGSQLPNKKERQWRKRLFKSILEVSEHLFNRNMLACIFTGFASGLPLYIIIQLVPAWLRSEQVDLKTIGFFALVGLPYTWKFMWAPIIDNFKLPILGRRRSWMLFTQIALFAAIAALGFLDPSTDIWSIAYICFAIAFFSASLDIVLDAYRREILPDEELGLGNSIHVNAYRIAGLVPGSLSLILADILPWQEVFIITAAFVLVGIIFTLFISEPKNSQLRHSHHDINSLIVDPFKDFISRHGVKTTLYILLFMLLYKVGDSMATALSTPFYLDLGFSKTVIGLVAKNAGLWPMVIGGIIGGVMMLKIGINKALWLFGFVQIISILGFALLAYVELANGTETNHVWLLAIVISFEYLGVGLGTAAFVAFIARSTSIKFAATQFALLTALTAVPRTFTSATTGVIVESIGWTNFYILCTFIAIPGMLLLFKVAPWHMTDKEYKQQNLKNKTES